MFIFTSGSSTLLGRPRCGLSIWLSLLAIFNTLFWVYANFFHEKTDKPREYWKSAIFEWCEYGGRRLLGAQSINTGRASLIIRDTRAWTHSGMTKETVRYLHLTTVINFCLYCTPSQNWDWNLSWRHCHFIFTYLFTNRWLKVHSLTKGIGISRKLGLLAGLFCRLSWLCH